MQLSDSKQPFVDSTVRDGQQRIRGYVVGWLERLDYSGKLDRAWSAEELGSRIWERIRGDYSTHLRGTSVATNDDLARVIAVAAVEDFFSTYPERRPYRYSVAGPLGSDPFRRAVLDFVHDLEEFEPASLPDTAAAAAEMFWADVQGSPRRWGYDPDRGPFVDDEGRARRVALEVMHDYFGLLREVEAMRRGE